MKLRYRRTGGIANIRVEGKIESNDLPADWQNVLKSAQGMNVQEPTQSDEFLHELFLEDGSKFTFTDSECNPALLQLFDQLYSLALIQSRKDSGRN